MIIKSTSRANGGKLADYLLKSQKNERAELLEMRGFAADNLKDALSLEEELSKRHTQCEKPLYHVAFRAAEGEELTPEQWQHCADKLEKRLGLEGHNRALVMHEQDGGQHMHVVWSRLDPETREVASLAFDHMRCKEVARELERELGLQKVRDHKREPERELAAPSLGEDQEARRKGQDLKETRAAIRAAWEKSKDGRSFADALKERGLELAKGDRRDFVAVDERGATHSIGKRTTGASAAEVREKLSDLDRERMPTVEQVREEQKRELVKAELTKEQERENLIERAKAELAKEAEREQQKAKREQRKEAEQEQKKREESRAAKLGATLYDRADLVSMQRDAMKDLRERNAERRPAPPQAKRDDDRQEQQRRQAQDDDNKRRQDREEEKQKPRYKSVAERVAEARAQSIAEAERRRSLSPAQRLEEDRQRDERERQLDRSGRERGRERER